MAILHILNKGSIKHPTVQDCLNAMDKKQDALLLIEDGVVLSEKSHFEHCGHPVFALQHDLHLRGLSPSHNKIEIVDDAGFVELCTKYDKTVSWF